MHIEANCYCAHRRCKVRVTVEITLSYPPKVAYISTPFELRFLFSSSDLLPTHSTRQATTRPTMDTAKSDTTTTPAPSTSPTSICLVCKQSTVNRCGNCHNVCYCSTACQEKDWKIHKLLCKSFTTLEPRPGPNFFRGIFFPPR